MARAYTGILIGSLLIRFDQEDRENPIVFEEAYGCWSQPLDEEDAQEIIKILRKFIREIKAHDGQN